MQPRVAIIYLCWREVDYLESVANALAAQTYPHDRMKVFLLPAGSPHGVQTLIREKVLPRSGKDLPETVMIDSGENAGFAGNNNVGIQQALDEGFDYVFLHNGDLTLHKDAIKELVDLAESDKKIASAQSLVLYWDDHEKVNVSGGVFHVAGYGYARDNLATVSDLSYTNGDEIAYASGAAVLYRSSILKEVGLLEEGFFMYHEDLELGLRCRMAGYKNVLAVNSLAYHDYQFSRNPKKFAWMEVYRWVVVKSYYKWPTLLLLAPLLLVIELGTWLMALKGGWTGAKVVMVKEALQPRTWKLIRDMRRRVRALRRIDDQDFLPFVSGEIVGQETESFVVQSIANPIVTAWLNVIKFFVRW